MGRKAWNEAMRNASGGTLVIPGLNTNDSRRSSGRQKRREKARKSSTLLNNSSGNETEAKEYRNAVRIDALEDVVGHDEMEEQLEDEYDELEDFEDGGGTRGSKRKRKGAASSKKKGAKSNTMPKRFKPRSLASILIEESSRGDDGVARKYLDAEARIPKNKDGTRNYFPQRHFCPVTGLEGLYTDPKSGIRYATIKALDQIRERAPPWVIKSTQGTASYHEACKSIRNEDG